MLFFISFLIFLRTSSVPTSSLLLTLPPLQLAALEDYDACGGDARGGGWFVLLTSPIEYGRSTYESSIDSAYWAQMNILMSLQAI